MTRLLVAAFLLLASLSPAAAQYSYSGSAGNLRTAPAQAKDKAASQPERKFTNQVNPAMTGQQNRMTPQKAESQRTQNAAPQKPQRSGTPLNSVPGQARPVPGVAR